MRSVEPTRWAGRAPMSPTPSTRHSANRCSSPWANTLGKAIWQTLTYEQGPRRLLTSQLDREVVPTYDSLTTYGYDLAGNITSIKDAPHSGTADTQCFRYDYLQQLTDAR